MTRKALTLTLSLSASILLALLSGCASKQAAPVDPSSGRYAFWPEAPDAPHIQFLTAFNSSRDLNEKKKGTLADAIYGAEPEHAQEINKPYGLRMWNGRIYVCDIRSSGVTVLDLRKKQTRLMGATGAGKINKASDLAIGPEGTKYVIDPTQAAILVFNPDERYITTWRFPTGSAPVGLAIWQNLLYVVDFKLAHVKVLDRTNGQILGTFGERGGEDGQFIGPLAVAVDKQGNIFVSDPIRARVQKFSPDGKFILSFGQAGNRPGNFIRPKQMGVGSDGRIHIVDAAFNNVQVFDPEGRVEGFYGAAGTHLGNMDLPAGLDVVEADLDLFARYIHPAFQAERLILVSNQFGNAKISVYAMGQLKPGKTVADIAPSRASIGEALVVTTQPALTTQPAVVSQAPEKRP